FDLKLFIMDVDGVLTDGGMYYSENGDELKKFNTTDGKGIELLRKSGIKTAIITSENTKIIDNRAEKLNIDYIYKGIRDKLKIAKKICEVEKISLNNVAFIGDDINDINLLKKVKLKACPSDAQEEVKKVNGIKVMNKEGGRGAVREFVNHLIYIE
ncbi:MAG: KdsC family phosphatase, partial [bacterium]